MTWGVYWQVQSHDFVNFDDETYISQNPNVLGGVTRESIPWAFSTFRTGNWHPLTWMSLMLDAQLFGPGPAGFLRTNALFHTANVLLLFITLCQMTGARWKSAFVAALFAVHPLHVESVAWASERKDVLSVFFGLISIYCYTRFVQQHSWKWYAWAFLAFAASLLSKQMLVTLPVLLLLLDYWPLERASRGQAADAAGDHSLWATWRPLIVEKLPWFALTAVFCLIAIRAQHAGGAISDTGLVPIDARIKNAAVVYLIYIRKTLLPLDLAVFYPHPIDQIPLSVAIFAGTTLLLLTVSAVGLARRVPYLFVGWMWYLISLLPVIGLLQVGGQQMADRYTYFPHIGLFMGLTWWLASLGSSRLWTKRLLPEIAVSALIGCSVIAWIQTGYWADSLSVLHRALTVTPGSYFVHQNFAVVLVRKELYEPAIVHLHKALQYDPENIRTLVVLGNCYYRTHNLAGARAALERAVAKSPNDVAAIYLLGVIEYDDGKFEKARKLLSIAVTLKPDQPAYEFALGMACARCGDVTEAMQHLRHAVQLKPDFAEAHNGLGECYAQQGQTDRAIQEFQQALKINPKLNLAQKNLQRAQTPERPAAP